MTTFKPRGRVGLLFSALPATGAFLLAAVSPGSAEVVDFRGSSSVKISQLIGGSLSGEASATTRFPEDVEALPAQSVARLVATDGDFPSAAAGAAQFADATTAAGDNPEQFAINLTLNSISPTVRFQASASASEVRQVRFSPGELGFGSNAGDAATIRGRVFLNGALTLISVEPDRDLSAAHATVRVRVVRSESGAADQTVFDGSIALQGTSAGDAEAVADGDFPTDDLVLTDLSVLNPDFDRFRVLVIPDLEIDYDFDIIVGRTITLTATVELDAANVEDNVGVSAIIGSPTSSLNDVLTVSRGASAASRVIDAIANERQSPTGDFAFPALDGPVAGIPLCGLLGFEALLAVAALAGAKRVRFRHVG